MKPRLFFISALILNLVLQSHTQTTVPGGDVSGTWYRAGSPYLIEGDITVLNDSTLTIEPGVRVEFQGHYSLTVLGRLLAIGSETDTILFTAADTTGFSDPDTSLGGWYGIRFIDTPVTNDSSKIVFCRLEFGKAVGPVWHLNAGGAICILQFGKVLISDCLILNNSAGSSTDQLPIGGGLYLFESDVIVRNNIFRNNRAYVGGAIYMDDSDPVFVNNIIEDNFAVQGGGIVMGGDSHPTFTQDEILNNTAENQGGGLLFWAPSSVKCDNVTLSGNRALWAGGIGVQGGVLQAEDCLFSGNRAGLWGGGVAGDFATLELSHCTFSKDTSDWGSGGLHMDHAVADIENCVFEDNRAVFGGGFHALYSQVSSRQNHFLRNLAESGGGVHLEDSDCTIESCQFSENQAINGTGGAIDCIVDTTIFGRSFRFNLSRTGIHNNSSSVNSGAVRIEQSKPDFSMIDVRVDSCQITGNHSDVYGSLRIGGYLEDFMVSSCIFSHNTSSRWVGGPGFISHSQGSVYNCVFYANYTSYSDTARTAHGTSVGSQAEVEFFNCTFTDTSSSDGVGLTVQRGSRADLVNCIFWRCGNRPVSITTAADLGCTVNINYCNIENGRDSITVSDSLSVLNWGNGNMAEDPHFVDILTGDLHLENLSPCIGSGINSFILNDRWYTAPTRDVEGNPRPSPQDSDADMGAYEHELGAPVGTGLPRDGFTGDLLLFQNYPNPASGSTTISYTLPVDCTVKLNLCNMLGQKVASLVTGNQPAGTYSAEWDLSAFPDGPYIYRLETGSGFALSQKLVLLKK